MNVIKHEGIINEIHDSNGTQIYNHINSKYGNIQINYNIEDIEKIYKKEIEKFKIKNNKENSTVEDYKEIINIRNICSKVNTYLNNYFSKNKNLHQQLISISYNDNNITDVPFKRKNKNYKKKYIIF